MNRFFRNILQQRQLQTPHVIFHPQNCDKETKYFTNSDRGFAIASVINRLEDTGIVNRVERKKLKCREKRILRIVEIYVIHVDESA